MKIGIGVVLIIGFSVAIFGIHMLSPVADDILNSYRALDDVVVSPGPHGYDELIAAEDDLRWMIRYNMGDFAYLLSNYQVYGLTFDDLETLMIFGGTGTDVFRVWYFDAGLHDILPDCITEKYVLLNDRSGC